MCRREVEYNTKQEEGLGWTYSQKRQSTALATMARLTIFID